ncbi:MAG: hypothetical protein IH588_18320 [Anaerolineales bacterium]|nr:hypothetical protein [Anaerolineales bacterium]
MTKKTSIRNNLLADLLLDNFRVKPSLFGLSVFVISSIIGYFYHLQTFPNVNTPNEILQYVTSWLWNLVYIPVMAYYFLWIPTQSDKLTESLLLSDTIDVSPDEIEIGVKFRNSRFRFVMLWAGGLVLVLLTYITRSISPYWFDFSTFKLILFMIAFFIGGYIVTDMASTLIINVIVLNKAFSGKNIMLKPLHPDGCGGFKFILDYSIGVTYLAAVTGFLIGITEYKFIVQKLTDDYWYFHLIIPIYLIGAIISFFTPLNSAHKAMASSKNKLLLAISKQYEQEYKLAQDALINKSLDLKITTDKLKEIEEFYKMTEKFPVWPFQYRNIKGFYLSIISPILPLVIGIIKDILV